MQHDLIIFDLDGTLAHTAPDLIGTLNRITADYNLEPISLEQFGKIIGHGAKAMITRSFECNNREIDEKTLEKLLQDFLDDYAQNIANETVLFENVLDAMDIIAENGFSFALCTNKTESMARLLLDKLDVTKRFKSITGGDTFDFRKPDARHLQETARLAGHTLEKAIMIGDSATDIDAAKNAGIASVAVTFGYTETPAHELGASKVISHFNELPAAIESISKA